MSSVARSEIGKVRRVAVVGAGPTGLMAALCLADAGVAVDLFASCDPARSGSVIEREGIAASFDDPEEHLTSSLTSASGLAEPALVRAMIGAAPEIVGFLDRAGVPFDRTPEGRLWARSSPGARSARTYLAGGSTGLLVTTTLDDQLRKKEQELASDARGASIPGESLVRRFIPFELVRWVSSDEGRVVGLVAQDLRSMSIMSFAYEAVLLATGGFSSLFESSAVGPCALGSALAVTVRQGAVIANPEMVQLSALGVAGVGKVLALPDWLRAEGARVFVPVEADSDSNAKAMLERQRNYVLPRNKTSAELPTAIEAARALAVAVSDKPAYLDLTLRKADAALAARLERLPLVVHRYAGVGLFDEPVACRPVALQTLGGLFIDHEVDAHGALVVDSPRTHATSLPGLYAAGAAAAGYHGAAALPDNLLLAGLCGAKLAAKGILAYRAALPDRAADPPRSTFDEAQAAAQAEYDALLEEREGSSTGESEWRRFSLALGRLLGRADEAALDRADEQARALELVLQQAVSVDGASYANQGAVRLRSLRGGLLLARLFLAGARARPETRGGFARVDHPRAAADLARPTLLRLSKEGEPVSATSADVRARAAANSHRPAPASREEEAEDG